MSNKARIILVITYAKNQYAFWLFWVHSKIMHNWRLIFKYISIPWIQLSIIFTWFMFFLLISSKIIIKRRLCIISLISWRTTVWLWCYSLTSLTHDVTHLTVIMSWTRMTVKWCCALLTNSNSFPNSVAYFAQKHSLYRFLHLVFEIKVYALTNQNAQMRL